MSRTTAITVALLALTLAGCRERMEVERAAGRIPSGTTFRSVVDAVLPSVVYIQVEARPRIAGELPFFHPQLPEEQMPDLPPALGAGSGVILNRDGYILTSDHVVQEADRVLVRLSDQREFEARVIARDPSTDVAVLKIDAHNLPTARLGDSDALLPGDWVLALGSPLDLRFTVTAGIVSAKGRSIGILDSRGPAAAAPLEHFIQTDAAINPGNSGGPLVNLAGEVVGINTAIASPTGSYTGYGFAVPINLAKRVAEELIRHGEVRRAFLGVLLADVDAADVKAYNLDAARGAEVVHVQENSPAARAGLRLGDVVTSVAGEEVETVSDLQAKLAALEPTSTTTLEVRRAGRTIEVPVRLGVIRTGIRPAPAPEPDSGVRAGFAIATQGGRPVVAAVRSYSAAARAGLAAGQIILAVNGRDVRTVRDVMEAIARTENGVLSLVVHDPRIRGRMIINFEPNR